MKPTLYVLLVVLIGCCNSIFAQSFGPMSSMNYQGVARDSNGDPVANQSISLKISIGVGAGLIYTETHSTITNDIGLFTVLIGDGVFVSGFGPFESILWNEMSNYSIIIEADFTGGTNYQGIGFTSIRMVPFAHTASTAHTMYDSSWVQSFFPSKRIFTDNGYLVGIGTDDPQVDLDVTGNVRIAAPGNVNSPDGSASLDMGEASGALLLPRISTTERDALVPTPGMMIFNTDCGSFQGYGGLENSAFASNQLNGSSATFRNPFGPTGYANILVQYQTFEVFKPMTLDSVRFWVSSWTSGGAPLLIYDLQVAEGTPDNVVGGTQYDQVDNPAFQIPGPQSGEVTVGLTSPYSLLPGRTYYFALSANNLNGMTAVLEASSGAGDYGYGERWEYFLQAIPNPPGPPIVTSGYNQFTNDLRFELIDNSAPALGWKDLH